MPSPALQKFESKLIVDVDKIISTHASINHSGQGRRGLGHLTRSGVVMLCAAWEVYIEEVILESVLYLSTELQHPKELPKKVQKELARVVKESKHELKPLELAGEGWKTLYKNHARETLVTLNTPKSGNLDKLFYRFLGIEQLSSIWSNGVDGINQFVSIRGDIAHKGSGACYIQIAKLRSFKTLVEKCVVETDNYLAEYLREKIPRNRLPWQRRLRSH